VSAGDPLTQAAAMVRGFVARFAGRGTPPPEHRPLTEFDRLGRSDDELGGWYQDAGGLLVAGFPIARADKVYAEGDLEVADFCRRHAGRLIDGAIEAVPSGSVSRICSIDALQHAADPAGKLGQLVRIGRPGALCLLAVPDPVLDKLLRQVAPAPDRRPALERDAFAALVTAAGLIIEDRQFHGFFRAMHCALRQVCDGDPAHPALAHWVATWESALAAPQGLRLKRLMDEFMPQRQLILARKP
jgi:hypothetical protein